MVETTAGVTDSLIHARAEYKALLNEYFFLDAKGEKIENPWHIRDWFGLAERYDRLLIEASREHGKTSIMALALPLIEMKLNRNVRILLISDVFEKSAERSRLLREHIDRNPRYRAERPEVKIARKNGDYEFTVERDLLLKEPTVRSTYAGGSIAGGRYDLVIADDMISLLLNSNTPHKRDRIRRWFQDEVLNSVAEGGKLWIIGTPQQYQDLYTDIERDKRFKVAKYPAIDEQETGYGDLGYAVRNAMQGIEDPLDQICLWPDMHDYASLMEKKDNTPDSFLSQQQMILVPETGLVFHKPLTDRAFERGKQVQYNPQAEQYLGIDPGYAIRAAMLAIQESTGDHVEMWREHSFTQMPDDYIIRTAVEHCEEYRVAAVFIDAEDQGLIGGLANALQARGVSTMVQPVPFGNWKRNSIKATRWLLGADRVSWRAHETIVHNPGKKMVVPSIFRNEIQGYAMKPDTDDEPMKNDDHGPDAWTAYASKWVIPWAKAMGIDLRRTEEQRQYGGLTRVK